MALVAMDEPDVEVLFEGAVLGEYHPVRCLFCLSPVVLYPEDDAGTVEEGSTAICPCCGTMYTVNLELYNATGVDHMDLELSPYRLSPETLHVLRSHIFGA